VKLMMRLTTPFQSLSLGALLCMAAAPGLATAQDDPAPPKSEQSQQQGETGETGGDMPSLDELLGLEEASDGPDSAAETAQRQQEEQLQRRLAEQEITDAFEVALSKMQLSAELLDVQQDTGLGTQRVQEEILASLDRIIENAEKMQSQSSSSSSSSSQQQQQQQSPGQQTRNRQSQGDQRSQQPSDSNAAMDPPPREEGPINTVIEESRVEWGALPERIRQELYQGRREKFSSIYDRLTREYYKRLAEEASP